MEGTKSNINCTIAGLLGNTDIYLIDQIMKNRYLKGNKILDAGCGGGRNMHWFLNNDIKMFGIDSSESAIIILKSKYPNLPEENLQIAKLEKIPFADGFFDHVICSAVLHFAKDVDHFQLMLSELVRVLKIGGSLFIRMTSILGIEEKVKFLSDGNYKIPDGSMRFLLTRELLAACLLKYNLGFLEPLKTVNVEDQRCMSTLILIKQ